MITAKEGETISWFCDGKKQSAEVAMVDHMERHYGVYLEHGHGMFSQELIDFDMATIEKTN